MMTTACNASHLFALSPSALIACALMIGLALVTAVGAIVITSINRV